MHTDTIPIIAVPLKKLLVWPGNVRVTTTDEGIPELAASIASVGLLHNLVVRREPRGQYAVIAGRRRLLALSHLVRTGKLKATWPVPCHLADKEADLTAINLSENVMREPMHPADEFLAFQRLIAEGQSIPDVAARFGVTEAVVSRRLALARVSPTLLQCYREGALTLEVLQAFTLTDDTAAQEQVWQQLPTWDRTARTVRRLLTDQAIPATDKRVRFVGLDRYEAQGGAVQRDLFADGDDGVYLSDAILLHRLVSEKLERLAEQVKADGWQWVQVQPELDYTFIASLRRVHPAPVPLSAEDEAELNSLDEERQQLESEWDEVEDEDSAASLSERLDAIDDRWSTLTQQRTTVYSAHVKAACGVVVSVGWDGEPDYAYGLLRKTDEKAFTKACPIGDASNEEGSSLAPSPTTEDPPTPTYPATLIESLTQHKTAALAVEMIRQPQAALAAVVHALVLNQFGLDLRLYRSQTCLQITTHQPSLGAIESSAAYQAMAQQRKEWLTQFPQTAEGLWRWCLKQDLDTLLRLLAFCAAHSVNAVEQKGDTTPHERGEHADAVAAALHLDMTRWFTPTADNFFRHVSKAHILAAMQEAGQSPRRETTQMKKANLAAFAEQALQGTGWLPETLQKRTSQPGGKEEPAALSLDVRVGAAN